MDILYVCLQQKNLKEIVSVCQPWHWKFCWRGKCAIRRSCVHFSSTVMFTITLQWKNLMLIFTGNNASEFSHFFGRCTTPTLHLAKIRHPWLAEAPESSIWNNLLWIFHCSHSLERSFGTPNAYNYQKFRSRAHPARMQLYYLTDLRFTLDLKYCSYEYSFSRSLKWLSRNHNAHKLPKSRTLSIKVFFFSQSKRVQKKKWSREVKNICQQLKLQSTSYSALVNSLSCICSDTSIV